jgi:hypothetical protein
MDRRESARIRFLEDMDRLAVTPQYRLEVAAADGDEDGERDE